MQTFEKYARSFQIQCDSTILDFSFKNAEYFICEGSKPLLTPGGAIFSHSSARLIFLILTDLQLFVPCNQQQLSSPLLYSYMKDILSAGEDPVICDWKSITGPDLFVQIKTTGKSARQPFGPEETLFAFSFVSLSGLTEAVNQFASRVMGEISLEENESHPFPALLKHFYLSLSVEQKTAVQALCSAHQAGMTMPLLLVAGEINPVEYVKGLLSLRIKQKEQFSEILEQVTGVQAWLNCWSHKPHYNNQLTDTISDGEGDTVEFKSTLRWDIRAGKTNPAIERACLKTISAFLNSSGGTLLIGVRDDGSIEGIETDKFANEDKFLLHLWTLIRTCLGRDFTPYIRTRLEKAEDKTVCMVTCRPADRPVFLRQPGFSEELFIRVGPSSNALDISEALTYIENHYKWPANQHTLTASTKANNVEER